MGRDWLALRLERWPHALVVIVRGALTAPGLGVAEQLLQVGRLLVHPPQQLHRPFQLWRHGPLVVARRLVVLRRTGSRDVGLEVAAEGVPRYEVLRPDQVGALARAAAPVQAEEHSCDSGDRRGERCVNSNQHLGNFNNYSNIAVNF